MFWGWVAFISLNKFQQENTDTFGTSMSPQDPMEAVLGLPQQYELTQLSITCSKFSRQLVKIFKMFEGRNINWIKDKCRWRQCATVKSVKTLLSIEDHVIWSKAPEQLLNNLRKDCFANCHFRGQEWTINLKFNIYFYYKNIYYN